MTRKKRKKNRISFKKGLFFRKKKKSGTSWLGSSMLRLLKISFIVAFVVAIGLLLIYADKKYIRPVQSEKIGPLVLIDIPQWVSEQLLEKIKNSAGGTTFKLDEKTAGTVAENLKSLAWLHDINVQTKDDSIQVRASYRRPVAIIKSGQNEFYIDAQQVVLDYVPMPYLTLVEIKNVQLETSELRYGQVWKRDDIAAALKILEKINQMDKTLQQRKPLISEISSIDVSNYHGIKNSSRPHIILYSKDNTEIQWGAEIGAWQKYLESTDEQKLAKLYNHYQEYGTLSGGVKYINLRDPQDKVPLPIDRY